MARFRFYHDLNLVVMEFAERVDDRGLLDFLLGVYDHPDFVPGMDEISSFLNTEDVQVSASGLREIARSFPRPGHHLAAPNNVAVITRTQLGYGLSRLYGAYADREGRVAMQVFATVDQAADWLDQRRARAAGTTARRVEHFVPDRQ